MAVAVDMIISHLPRKLMQIGIEPFGTNHPNSRYGLESVLVTSSTPMFRLS